MASLLSEAYSKAQMFGVTPSKIMAAYRAERLGIPKVIANSIPKSGTNLLLRALYLNTEFRRRVMRTLRDVPALDLRKVLASTRPGHVLAAHLPHDASREDLIRSMGFRNVLQIRDPRDIAVSNFIYITYKDLKHPLHRVFKFGLSSDHERLMAAIDGIDLEFEGQRRITPGIGGKLKEYADWLQVPDCLIVRFENLIGATGGGDNATQFDELNRLFAYLGMSHERWRVEEIGARLFFAGSRTFHKGQIGAWKDHFSSDHKTAFKRVCGDSLISLGYETDGSW